MSILYSPIGKSDPIRSEHDGPWLHICRAYRPRMTLIYLSAEMTAHDRKGIYEGALKKLCDFTGAHIELRKNADPERTAAHEFEPFIDIFRRDIDALHAEFPDEEILLNISSGTTAMKTALVFIHGLLPYKVKTIQVSNPQYDKRADDQVSADYDLELHWAFDKDNLLPSFINRTSEQNLQRYALHAKIDDICQWVNAYEYYAAWSAAEKIKPFISPKALQALQGAWLRYQLKSVPARSSLQVSGFELTKEMSRHAEEKDFKIAEYIQMMRVKACRGEVTDVVRCMTPVFFSLCELTLDKIGYTSDKLGIKRNSWKSNAEIPSKILSVLNREFGYRFLGNTKASVAHFIPLINEFCDSSEIKESISTLRNIETTARNDAAHQMIAYEDSEFKKLTGGYDAEGLVKELIKLFKLISTNNYIKSTTYWKSYDSMNRHIVSLLQKISGSADAP